MRVRNTAWPNGGQRRGSDGYDRRAVLAGAALSCLSFIGARAATGPKVYFGGHAFLSKFSDIKTGFPYLGALLDGDGGVQFDRALLAAGRQGGAQRKLDIDFDGLAALGAGREAVVMALAFDREVVQVSQLGRQWLMKIELSFQALVFDFSSKVVRASFPIAVGYNDLSPAKPSDADVRKAVDHLLNGGQAGSVVSKFWSTVADIALPEPGARSLRVTKVALADAAAASLAQMPEANAGALTDNLGSEFGAFLSSNQKISVLPYASTQAVDGKMAARLSNGVIYNLTIPAPDYAISLTLDGLKKVQFAATPAGTTWIYGAFVTIAVVEPLSGKTYFNDQVKLGANRTVPATQGATEDWPSFDEAIRQLFNEFTQALSGPDAKWAKDHVVKNPASIKALKDLVVSCR